MIAAAFTVLLAATLAVPGATCPVPEGPVRDRAEAPDGATAIARDGALEVGDRRVTTCEGLPGAFPTAVAPFAGGLAVGFRAAGLHLWDGDAFRRVRGLPDDAIRVLEPDGEALWVGTGGSGLWRLGPDGGVERIDHWILRRTEISALHVEASGALRVGAGMYGLWRVSPDGGVRRLRRGVYVGCFREQSSLPGSRVADLAPGPGCSLGDAPPASGLPSAHVSAVAVHRGRLVVGTFDAGLARLGPDGRFEPVEGSPPFVNTLLPDGDRLWVATPKGLWRVDGDGPATRLHLGLPSEHVNGLAMGLDGTLWLATGEGLAAVSPGGRVRIVDEERGLPSRIVYAVAVTDDGAVWAGTAGGAARIGPDGVTRYTMASGALPHDWVNALLADGETVLAGTYDAGVARLFPDGTGAPEEGLGRLWVNPSGLARLDDGRLAVTTLGDGLILRDGARTRTMGGLPSTDVTSAVLHDGALWVGTRGGLVRFDTAE